MGLDDDKKLSCLLYIVFFFTVSLQTNAKPSVYFGVNVNLPVQQQTTITHHVQPILPKTQVQHYQATYSRKDYWDIPEELGRFSKQTSVYYHQPPHRNMIPNTTVYVPTTVIYQTNTPYRHQSDVNFTFRVGGIIPTHYRMIDYWVSDWQQVHLSAPPQGHLWLNIGGHFLLVNQPNYTIVKIQ